MLVVTGVALYIVAPRLIATFGSLPQLEGVFPAWFVPIGLLEGLAFVCIWVLIRVALATDGWFDVAALAARRQRAQPRAAGRRGDRRGDDVPDAARAPASDGATTSTALTAGRSVVDRDAVRAPGARAPGDDLRAGGELGAVAGRAARRRARHLRARPALRSCSCPTASSAAPAHARLGSCTACCDDRCRRRHWPIGCVESRDFVRTALARIVEAGGSRRRSGNQLFDFLALDVSLLAVGSRVDPDARAARVRRRPARWR